MSPSGVNLVRMKNNLAHIDNVQNSEEFGLILFILLMKRNGINLNGSSSTHSLEDFSCEIQMLIPIAHTENSTYNSWPSDGL